ncbi:MAG: putative transrane sensory transduction histidine kinase for metal resistance [Frankiales bacterium]|nr:putative transrane sensory transduction histidine kinase for metal resistance [Frankiales bacterium]
MPLRLRLALLFAGCAALVIAAAGLAFVLQLRVGVEASLDPGLRTRVRAVADELASADGLRPGPVDQLLQVRSVDGHVVAASPDASGLALLDAAQTRQAWAGEIAFTGGVGGDRTRLLATSIRSSGQPLLVIVGSGTDVADAAVARARSALLTGGPPAVLAVGAGAWLLAGAALRPVERMRREAAAISDRDTGRLLPLPRTQDEIAALAVTFNELLVRLQSALERERAFVADAGHELRTPLAVLRAELELAARPGRTAESLRAAVEEAAGETDRLIRLAEDLLLLARADSGQPFLDVGPVAFAELLAAAARGARTRAADRGVEVEVRCTDGLTMDGDSDRLRQAADNLLDNATRHSPDGGVVVLAGRPGPSGTVVIEVCDRGPGFPPDFLPRAFERFQRAESARARNSGGSGLGLSIVRAIAEAHGGTATAANRPGGGAVVVLELPSAAGG